MDYRCCAPLMWVHWKGIRVGDVIHFCLWPDKISSEQQPMHDPAKLWINKGTMHSWWHILACISCIILVQSCKGGFQSLNKSEPLLPPALSCRQHSNEGKIALLKILQSLGRMEKCNSVKAINDFSSVMLPFYWWVLSCMYFFHWCTVENGNASICCVFD